jgi:ribose transport system permease protein
MGMTKNNRPFGYVKRFQSVLALALMVVALSLLSDKFLSVDNSLNVLRQICVNLCLSIGMTIIIVSGGIDLSVGSMLALSGAMAAGLLKNGIMIPGTDVFLEVTVSGAILVGVLVGTALGWFNGYVITRFKLPPFVATLGMLSIARGLTMLWTGGFPITRLGDSFGFLGSGHRLGVPMPVWISGALVAVFIVVMKRTRFGRHVYAVGGSEKAARLSGLNVRRIKLLVYTLGGALAGVAGLLVTARLDSATPNAGFSYELDSIAAVVIGGTSLNGGRGTIMGTVLGCLIIGVLNNGLVLLEVSPFWQQVIKGFVILVAVAVDKMGEKVD